MQVPEDIKNALAELKTLAKEHVVVTKRGSKRKFIKKIWGRMH
jgi:predicted transcriptional regulator YdeE